MPRRARLLLPNVPFHIIHRGNNRSACFFADDDYDVYLGHLTLLAREHQVLIHAYVLMTNHIHLLLTPCTRGGLSAMMKHLSQRYVQHVNRLYQRSGSLWEGRFRSAMVDADGYLMTCQRYIELNPVRAAMVEHPADYPWSSFRCNGVGQVDSMITPHPLYLSLGDDAGARRAAYRELFREELDSRVIDDIRSSTNGGFVLGNGRFQEQISATLKRRVVRAKRGRRRKSEGQEVQAAIELD